MQEKQLSVEKIQLSQLKEVVQAFEEIAVSHMRNIRTSVLQTREFLVGLTMIFQDVKFSYKKEVLKIIKQKNLKDLKRLSVRKRNGKIAIVLISANTGLYGALVRQVYELFSRYIKENQQADPIIIGRLGKAFFSEQYPNKTYTYFDFPDAAIEVETLKKLITLLLDYEDIYVCYGKFDNIISQTPTMLDIYASSSEEVLESANKPLTKYFFEPSLERIMFFFEAEIFASIFEQTLSESHLAKYAARMLSLDQATDNISRRLLILGSEERVQQHRKINKKQLEGIAGISLWKK